eukprot:19159-Heterococcus_DN1.PRE.7
MRSSCLRAQPHADALVAARQGWHSFAQLDSAAICACFDSVKLQCNLVYVDVHQLRYAILQLVAVPAAASALLTLTCSSSCSDVSQQCTVVATAAYVTACSTVLGIYERCLQVVLLLHHGVAVSCSPLIRSRMSQLRRSVETTCVQCCCPLFIQHTTSDRAVPVMRGLSLERGCSVRLYERSALGSSAHA